MSSGAPHGISEPRRLFLTPQVRSAQCLILDRNRASASCGLSPGYSELDRGASDFPLSVLVFFCLYRQSLLLAVEFIGVDRKNFGWWLRRDVLLTGRLIANLAAYNRVKYFHTKYLFWIAC